METMHQPMIQILPPEVANRIAAGEVVERPASVVRELIDNAIDAGATRVDVEVEEGGLKQIRVTDNGSGMSSDDAALCVKRHATSKIRDSDDLAAISSRGFRGEALAAIGSVSHFELTTRREEDELGVSISVEGGKENPPKPIGAAVGTVVTIKNLFYNTPARKKFLKKPATEQGHVLSTITWNALAHERVHFTFTQNGRTTLDIPSVSNRPERIKQIFGPDIIENLIPVNLDSPVLSISGLISRPTLTRNGAQHIYFFVNDRFIKDRLLHRAMMNGYRNLLPAGRYPVVFLFLDIDPSEIDINVHPTKQEIKFSREDAVFSATYGAIRQAWDSREDAKKETQTIFESLKSQKDNQEPKKPYTPKSIPASQRPQPTASLDIQKMGSQWLKQEEETTESTTPPQSHTNTNQPPEPQEDSGRAALPQSQSYPNQLTEPQEEPGRATLPQSQSNPNQSTEPQDQPGRATLLRSQSNPPETHPGENQSMEQLNRQPLQSQSGLDDLKPSDKKVDDLLTTQSIENATQCRVIGQLMNCYILAETQQGLCLIDQHAAHERLMFEKFLTQSQKASLASQSLLFPITLDFSPDDAVLLEENRVVLKKLGFDIEPFGPRTYAVHAIPSSLNNQEAEEFIKDYLGELQHEGSLAEKHERGLHTLACKAAVKFGDPLPQADMEAIIQGLESIPRRNVCPHGRPAVLFISDQNLRKAFKRTGF